MRNCIICGDNIYGWERYICTKCKAEIPLTYFWSTLNNPAESRFREHTEIKRAYSLFFFTGRYKEILHLLKYKGHTEVGAYFGRILGEKIAECCIEKNTDDFFPDSIIPIPLHWIRKIKRGYNQAEVIARGISNGIYEIAKRKVDVNSGIIKRNHITKTQTKKNKEDRYANMYMAFSAKNSTLQIHNKHSYKHLLIVDDVFTTGSTLRAAINAIKEESIYRDANISIATLAYVE